MISSPGCRPTKKIFLLLREVNSLDGRDSIIVGKAACIGNKQT